MKNVILPALFVVILAFTTSCSNIDSEKPHIVRTHRVVDSAVIVRAVNASGYKTGDTTNTTVGPVIIDQIISNTKKSDLDTIRCRIIPANVIQIQIKDSRGYKVGDLCLMSDSVSKAVIESIRVAK